MKQLCTASSNVCIMTCTTASAGIRISSVTHTNIHLGKGTLTALMFKVRQTPAVLILSPLTLATVAIHQVVEFYSWFYSVLKYPGSFKAQHVTLILIMQRCVEELVGGAFKNK